VRRRPEVIHSNARAVAEQRAHEVGAAGVGDEADVDERGHEGRVVGGEAQVAGAASERPAPAAGPFTAAITGFSSARMARMFGW
jgi:hypothetical protein